MIPNVSRPLKIDENWANISGSLGYSILSSVSTFSKLSQNAAYNVPFSLDYIEF